MKNLTLTLIAVFIVILSFGRDAILDSQADEVIMTVESTGINIQDSLALVALYNATGGPNWTNNENWLSKQPVSTWYGVVYVNENRVVQLILAENNLVGTIPPEIGQLTNLGTLYLYRNQLSGPIPPELGLLTNLTNLMLFENKLSGSIPVEIEHLTKLSLLYLNNNQLTGTIPSGIGMFSNLTWLMLHDNQLSGVIPAEIGNLTNLRDLGLGNNQFTGSIPFQLGQLTSLYYFSLNNNQLTGTIPGDLGNLSNLLDLYLSNNQLSGSIPPELGQLTNLSTLCLEFNQLTGEIPSELGQLTNLWGLNLHYNRLEGNVPPELSQLSNLHELRLGFNQLTGSIPAELSQILRLNVMALDNNQLTGTVPIEILEMPSLEKFYLNENFLDELPDFTKTVNLDKMDMFDNNFTFEDFEYNMVDFVPPGSFLYSPQNKIGQQEVVQLKYGDNYTLEAVCGGTDNLYQWFHDGEPVGDPSQSSFYVLENVELSDAGNYECHITNSLVINLTINTEPILVSIEENNEPVAYAGADQSVIEGTLVTLDGLGSTDPDGNPLTYHWIAPDGITLSSNNVAQPTFAAPLVSEDTQFSFSLIVNDGIIDSQSDEVIVTIININNPPVVICNNITINLNIDGTYSFSQKDLQLLTNGTYDDKDSFRKLIIDTDPYTFTCTDAGNTIPVNITVTDIDGAYSSCIANVLVLDVNGPSFSKGSKSERVTIQLGEIYTLPDYSIQFPAIDNCGSVIYSQTPAPGTTYSVSTVENISLIATDRFENSTEAIIKLSLTVKNLKSGESLTFKENTIESEIKAYPNPFTEQLNFEIQSAKSGKAILELFDPRGALTTTLFNMTVEENQFYQFQYRPANVASGMLFYRLIINEDVIIGKVIYNKQK